MIATYIDPGAGYRLLEKGERLVEGDEHWDGADGRYYKTLYVGSRVGEYETGGYYRRRSIAVQEATTSTNIVTTEDRLAAANIALSNLQEKHYEVVKELENLRTKIQELSKENQQLQRGLTTRNEKCLDLEFALRTIRKSTNKH